MVFSDTFILNYMDSVKNISKYVLLGLVFLVSLTPLFVSQSMFFPFITSKNFFFRIIIELAFGLWVILAIFDKSVRPKKSPILWLTLALALSTTLSTIFGANPYRSFWSNFERMEGLITVLHLTAYFLILVSVLKTKQLWSYFLNTSLGVSLILVIYGFFQIAGKLAIHQSGTRLDATLGNASYFAVYMLVHAFLSLYFFFRTKNNYRWIYAGLSLLQLIVLYHTATRGAILGFLGGVLLSSALIVFLSKNRKLKINATIGLAVIVLIIGIFWSFRSSNFVKSSPVLSRFSDLSLTERTTQSRLFIWKLALTGAKERPLLGWGPENFNLVFNKYYDPILYSQEVWFDRAHNIVMDRLATTGALGLLIYLSLFFGAIFSLWRKDKEGKGNFTQAEAAVLTGLFAGYFFHNLFVFDNITSSILFYSLIAFIHSQGGEENLEVSKTKKDSSGDYYLKCSLALIIGLATLFLLYKLNVPAYLTSQALINGFQSSNQSRFDESFNNFTKAINYDSLGTTEAREHFSSFAFQLSRSSNPNITQELKNTVYTKAVLEMEKQVKEAPDDIRYLLFLATIQNGANRYDKGIETLKRAIELSPKKQVLFFELASAYINQGDYSKAVEVAKRAFELETTFDDSRKIYAIASIYNGNMAMADSLFTEAYKKPIAPDQRLVNAYVSQKRYDRVAQTWEALIEEEPSNTQYHISLAATYYLYLNRPGDAIKELNLAKKLNLSGAAEIDRYISQVRSGQK